MKIKTYLFRLFIGLTAFFFSIGVFAFGRYLFTAAPPAAVAAPPVYMGQSELSKYHDFMKAEPIVEEPTAEEKAAEKEAAAKFDAEGSYYFNSDAPKGFEDFENFTVNNKDYSSEDEEEYGKLIAPQGFVQAKNEFNFKRISIGDAQIQFETESVKGITYTFTGHFIETGNFNYLDAEKAAKVLEGRLVKKRRGVKIAETDAGFRWILEMSCGC